MNKEDMKLMSKTEEQNFASSIRGQLLTDWKTRKRFMALSDRTHYIFEPSDVVLEADSSGLKGVILTFIGEEERPTPDLGKECILIFSDGKHRFRYATGKTPAAAMKEIDSSKLPLLSDLSLIEDWKDKIRGMTLWTKSNLWYDRNGNRQNGLKYAKVTVTDIQATTGDFPLNVEIRTEDGQTAYMLMNSTADLPDSRNFATLFYLADPKLKYPQITDENWQLIKIGKVAEGMTKEECRLALGNPDDLAAGHSTSQLMDVWYYSNGTFLMFKDGLLTKFKQ